jgi:quinoprotein glucose dehydrogenase
MRLMRYIALTLFFAASLPAADDGWSAYGRDRWRHALFAAQTSHARQCRQTEGRVDVSHRRAAAGDPLNAKAAFEATPILVNGTLYFSTPFNQVIALDPATGAEKWKFDPQVSRTHGYSEVTSRGVAAWTDNRGAMDGPCQLRIFEGTIDARLLAIDGQTGKLCADFGDAGQVDLTQGVDYQKFYRGNYQVTSAPRWWATWS